MPTIPSYENLRLRFVNPNDFSKPVLNSLQSLVDGFFMHTPLDYYTAKTYVTVVGGHVVEVEPEKIHWSIKKTLIHAAVLVSMYFVLGKKTKILFYAAYLSMPLLSMFLARRNADLYKGLETTREILKTDLSALLTQENALRKRLGQEDLAAIPNTDTFENRKAFLALKAQLENSQTQQTLDAKLETLKSGVGELITDAGEQTDLQDFLTKLESVETIDTIVQLTVELATLRKSYSDPLRAAACKRLQDTQFRERFAKGLTFYFRNLETVKARLCQWERFYEMHLKKTSQNALDELPKGGDDLETTFDKSFKVAAFSEFKDKDLQELNVSGLSDDALALIKPQQTWFASEFMYCMVSCPEGFEKASTEQAHEVIEYLQKEAKTEFSPLSPPPTIPANIASNPFYLLFKRREMERMVAEGLMAEPFLEKYQIRFFDLFQKREALVQNPENPMSKIMLMLMEILPKLSLREKMTLTTASSENPQEEFKLLQEIKEQKEETDPELAKKIEEVLEIMQQISTQQQNSFEELVRRSAFFVLYSEGHWDEADIALLYQTQNHLQLTPEEFCSCITTPYSELTFNSSFPELTMQGHEVDVEAFSKLLAMMGFMVSKALAKHDQDKNCPLPSVRTLMESVETPKHRALLSAYNHIQFKRWADQKLGFEIPQDAAKCLQFAKQAELDTSSAWTAVTRLESPSPEKVKETLCFALGINQAQFNCLVAGKIEEFKMIQSIEDPD